MVPQYNMPPPTRLEDLYRAHIPPPRVRMPPPPFHEEWGWEPLPEPSVQMEEFAADLASNFAGQLPAPSLEEEALQVRRTPQALARATSVRRRTNEQLDARLARAPKPISADDADAFAAEPAKRPEDAKRPDIVAGFLETDFDKKPAPLQPGTEDGPPGLKPRQIDNSRRACGADIIDAHSGLPAPWESNNWPRVRTPSNERFETMAVGANKMSAVLATRAQRGMAARGPEKAHHKWKRAGLAARLTNVPGQGSSQPGEEGDSGYRMSRAMRMREELSPQHQLQQSDDDERPASSAAYYAAAGDDDAARGRSPRAPSSHAGSGSVRSRPRSARSHRSDKARAASRAGGAGGLWSKLKTATKAGTVTGAFASAAANPLPLTLDLTALKRTYGAGAFTHFETPTASSRSTLIPPSLMGDRERPPSSFRSHRSAKSKESRRARPSGGGGGMDTLLRSGIQPDALEPSDRTRWVSSHFEPKGEGAGDVRRRQRVYDKTVVKTEATAQIAAYASQRIKALEEGGYRGGGAGAGGDGGSGAGWGKLRAATRAGAAFRSGGGAEGAGQPGRNRGAAILATAVSQYVAGRERKGGGVSVGKWAKLRTAKASGKLRR